MVARVSLLGALLAFLLATGASGQDGGDPSAKHWPLAKISFPVDMDRVLAANPRPVSLRFYARPLRGKFDLVAEKKLDELDEIDDLNSRVKKRGFHYTSAADGRVDFALQYVFASGATAPTAADLAPQFKIVFDTRQPLARMAATGARSVKWTVEDENLVPSAVRLEVRSAGGQAWTTVTTREFGPNDAYTWAPFDRNRVLEVRVVGKDRAGHEGVSNIVRITGGDAPAGGGALDPLPLPGGGRLPAPGGAGPGGTIGTGFGGPDDFPNRPKIDYVNDQKLVVRSKPTRVTRSGIPKAVLWMKEQTGPWTSVKTNEAVNITQDDRDKEIAIAHDTTKDGLYQFIIQPINGAGQMPDNPKDGDPPHWVVEVDTVKPVVKIKGVKAVPGGLNGPRVEIDYEVVEKNPMPEPITIEYSSDNGKGTWHPIAANVPNTSKYVWEIEDRNVWKFHVRVTAKDRAGNVGTETTKEMATVDLDKPAAVIERVDKQNDGKRNFRPDEHNPDMIPSPNLPPVKPEPPKIEPAPMLPAPVPPMSPKAEPPKADTKLPIPPAPGPVPKLPEPAKPKEPAKSPTSVELPNLPAPPGGGGLPGLPDAPGVPVPPALPTSPEVPPLPAPLPIPGK